MQLIIAGLLVLPLVGCSKEKMKLANKEITVKYGQTISADVKDYHKNDSDYCVSYTNVNGDNVFVMPDSWK